MRFSCTIAAGVLLLSPWATSAQDASAPLSDDAVAAEAENPAAPEPGPPVQDEPCTDDATPELEQSFGETQAWPDDGQAMYTPAGLSVLGHQVSYVLVKHGGSGGRIEEIGYRLQGMQRKVGQPHDAALLKAFDDEFKGADCAKSTQSSCGVVYRPEGKAFTGAEIGSGEIDVGSDARGPSLALIEADYDLLDADPVFLVCFYRGS